MIFSGRCYEQESVPFKAIDSLVDRLADFLDWLTEEELDAILPATVDELAQIFPMLSRVEAIDARRLLIAPIHDPHEMRPGRSGPCGLSSAGFRRSRLSCSPSTTCTGETLIVHNC